MGSGYIATTAWHITIRATSIRMNVDDGIVVGVGISVEAVDVARAWPHRIRT